MCDYGYCTRIRDNFPKRRKYTERVRTTGGIDIYRQLPEGTFILFTDMTRDAMYIRPRTVSLCMKGLAMLKSIKQHTLYLFLFGCFIVYTAEAYAQNSQKKVSDTTTIMVSAAISMKDVVTRIADDFTKLYPTQKVVFNFGSSGQLGSQIENDAPVDIFISASDQDMQKLIDTGKIVRETKAVIAKNRLVFIVYRKAKSETGSIGKLNKPSVKKIALGSVESVPAGRYAMQSLQYYKMWSILKEKLVFAENVRQVLDYVSRNEVDGGFVYATDAKIDDKVKVMFTLPDETHDQIVYPVGILKSSKNFDAAKAFINYLLSSKSREVFSTYGFLTDFAR